MLKRILGLDISSSCIGWGLVEWNTETNHIAFLEIGYVIPPEKVSDESSATIERLCATREAIIHLLEQHQPDYIGIEDIIQFMKNKSSAKSIITLAVFNRMLGLLCHDYLGHSPSYFNILAIRHGLKVGKILPDKSDIPALVSQHLGITFPWELNKREKPIIENYDKADGMAVALFLAQNLAGILPKKKVKASKK